MDPQLKYFFPEQTSGVGASYSWDGPKMKTGGVKVKESDPEKGLVFDLTMDRENTTSEAAFTYEPVEGGTKVTWSMDVEAPKILHRYMMKLMTGMMNKFFDRGLEKLKTLAEKE